LLDGLPEAIWPLAGDKLFFINPRLSGAIC